MFEGAGPGDEQGTDVCAREGGRSHSAQLYGEAAFLHRAVARFLGEGFRARERLVMFATPSSARAVRRRLARDGHDTRAARRAGLLTVVDARAALSRVMAGGTPDPERFGALVGGAVARNGDREPPVRVYGEMVDLLWQEGARDAALRLERLWNALAAVRPFRLLCAYGMRGFEAEGDGAGLERICDVHERVLPDESWDAGAAPASQLRRIAMLQQRARALGAEVRRRRQLEGSLRAALADVRRAEEALCEADRRKDELLAMLGHELRNPLSAVTSGLELLRMRGTAGEVGAVVERQLHHLVRLVDDLLDASRLTRGVVRIQKEPVELGAVLARAIEMVRPLCARRQHALAVDVPLRGLVVEADPARLVQVFGNLLANAATYTAPGGRIAVGARREGHEVVASVADNGAGIAAEMLPRVFDLFVQGERAPDRPEGGLGIGLTLARSLVELHGGTIEAHSGGRGAGAELVVRLPAVVLERPAPERGDLRRAAAAPPLRVLLVDDNRDAAEALCELLRGSGHEVALAHDGASALAIASAFLPDVALLDIGLPVMDGHELAHRLRELLAARPPRLVALTGYGREADRERSRAAGFEAHLVKPVDLDAVLALLRAAGAAPAATA